MTDEDCRVLDADEEPVIPGLYCIGDLRNGWNQIPEAWATAERSVIHAYSYFLYGPGAHRRGRGLADTEEGPDPPEVFRDGDGPDLSSRSSRSPGAPPEGVMPRNRTWARVAHSPSNGWSPTKTARSTATPMSLSRRSNDSGEGFGGPRRTAGPQVREELLESRPLQGRPAEDLGAPRVRIASR